MALVTFRNVSTSLPAILALCLLAARTAAGAGAVTTYDASDPAAPVVTQENLLASERFWPYRVALDEPWQPPGRERPIPARYDGVLLRVEADGRATVDFGRHGRWTVPVAETDLLARANQVREGSLTKLAPNLTLVLGPRLVPSDKPINYALKDLAWSVPGYLLVFAAPEDFEELASALAPLHERHGVWMVLFPQGQHVDGKIRQQIRSLDWKVPFLPDAYAEAYTFSQLGEDVPLPAVMLQTNEGRLLFQGSWGADTVAELRSTLDAAFGTEGDGAADGDGAATASAAP